MNATPTVQNLLESACSPYKTETTVTSFLHKMHIAADGAQTANNPICEQVKDVLLSIAQNPATPVDVLSCLAVHPRGDVRAAVATNHATSMQIYRQLCFDPDPNVRFQLSGQLRIPVYVLRVLTRDENSYVACRAKSTLRRVLFSYTPSEL